MGESVFDQVGSVVKKVTGKGGESANYRVSTTGDVKLNNAELGRFEYIILAAIKRHEPCSPDEVVKDPQVKFQYQQVYDAMVRFKAKGWILEDSPR
jgi:hypothetical protein